MSDLNIEYDQEQDQDQDIVYYMEDGRTFDNITMINYSKIVEYNKNKLLVVAKKITKSILRKRDDKNPTLIYYYYVLCYGGRFFDVTKRNEPRYKTQNDWKFKPVSHKAFDLYVRFIENKYKSLLYNAEREM